MAIAVPSGEVLVTYTPRPGSTSTEIYDPASGSWRAGPALLQTRSMASAQVLLDSGGVLVAGGNYGSSGMPYVTASEILWP